MSNVKKLIITSCCATLMACGSSTDGDPSADNGNSNPNGNYKSDYCVSDISNEEDDVFVFIDGFSRGPDVPASLADAEAPGALGNILLFSSLSIGTVGINFEMLFGPLFASGLCEAETAPDSQCDLTIPNGEGGGIRAIGSATLSSINFELFTQSAGSSELVKLSTFTGALAPHWQGSYRLYVDPTDATSVETLMTWSRDGSTERYETTSTNGDFMKATESSDCSGTLSSRTTEDDGVVVTVDGSWSLNGTSTRGEVTKCRDGECGSLSW